MFEAIAALSAAVGEAQVAAYHQASEAKTAKLLAEHERWEDENLLPLMTAEAGSAFLVERRRQRERREDIWREEKQHKERLAAEYAKASALRERASALRRRSGFGLGLLLGFVAGEG